MIYARAVRMSSMSDHCSHLVCVLAIVSDVGDAVCAGGAFELVCVVRCIGVEGTGVMKRKVCMDSSDGDDVVHRMRGFL